MNNRIQSAFGEIHADEALIHKTSVCLRKEIDKRSKCKKIRFMRPTISLASAVALVFGLILYNLCFTAYAYVSIDANPMVELTLNRIDRVIGVKTIYNDGSRTSNESKIKWKRYDEATALLLSDGYLIDSAIVSVAVHSNSNDKEQLICSTLESSIDDLVEFTYSNADIEIIPVSSEIWNLAQDSRISPSKYLAIQELISIDEEATVDAYSNSSIGQIRQRMQECRGMHSAVSEQSDRYDTSDDTGETGSSYNNTYERHGHRHMGNR